MLGFAWLALRQAQEALNQGRLEDAQRLLGPAREEGHKGAWELLKQLANAFVERGERCLDHEDAAGAWHNLLQAEQIGAKEERGLKLRQALTRLGLAEARTLLESGEPARAAEAVAQLRDRGVRVPELEPLGEAAKDWLFAREQANRAEIHQALLTLERVKRLLPVIPTALEKYQKTLQERKQTLTDLLVRLHGAAQKEQWQEVLKLAEEVLGVAPQHVEARRLRSRAWKAIEPITTPLPAPRPMPVPKPLPEENGQFLLWIDGVGGYLVCLKNRVTFGQAGADRLVDVPIFADVSRVHASLTRDTEGYLLEALRPVQVNGKPADKLLLRNGDRMTLGNCCQIQFQQPAPVSASARLDLVSGHRLPLAVDGVLLMAETLVLGPGSQVHVAMPDLKQQLILFRHKGMLGVRWPGSMTVNGRVRRDRASLELGATVTSDEFALTLEPVARRDWNPSPKRRRGSGPKPSQTLRARIYGSPELFGGVFMKFTYSSGQRPLEGYTLKRGIGRGGFGEVYYGLSDGGKEVALKLIQVNLEVELRGMSQCLNFKHPNLVNLFDIRRDTHGDHWVVMEYVTGETLSTVLHRHPTGVPTDLARQWFQGIAAAVAYLHDHGIVHRDLKPGNVFLENGAIKVGDYGLCKFMASSQVQGQTQSVGTVHYMAPEVSTGNYNKQIDIYALGILLFELLTGKVPFDGESAGEILMKHLTTPPDLKGVQPEFVPILDKALAKNPALRYQSVGELMRDVAALGAMAVPLPMSPRPVPKPMPSVIPVPVLVSSGEVIPSVLPAYTLRGQLTELSGSMVLTVLLTALICLVGMAVFRIRDAREAALPFFLTVAVSWAVLIPSKFWGVRTEDQSWKRRIALLCLGLGVGAVAMWLEGYEAPALLAGELRAADQVAPLPAEPEVEEALAAPKRSSHSARIAMPVAASYLSFFALALFALRWWKLAELRRPQRFGLGGVIAAGVWAYVLMYVFWPRPEGAIALVLSAVVVQLVSPWQPTPPKLKRRLRLQGT